MGELSTIQINKQLIELLRETKEYPRQTYAELLRKMIDCFKVAKNNNQYDAFLHTIQQEKMKELWNNNSDEEWARVQTR